MALHESRHRGREDPHGANNSAYFHSQQRPIRLDRRGNGLRRSRVTCLLKNNISQSVV